MENNNNSITYVYKSEESITEIDFVMRDEILGKGWEDKEERFEEIIVINPSNGWARQSSPIKIDEVISVLQNLKKDGSNYVEIMYHEDHIGYYFNGVDIHNSTFKEVLENNKKKEEFENAKKLAEIDLLQRKIDTIKKTLNK